MASSLTKIPLSRLTKRLHGTFYRNLSTSHVLQKRFYDEGDYNEVPTPPKPNPLHRARNIIKHDIKGIFDENLGPMEEISRHIDIAIIGGGVMGSAIAYFMKCRLPYNSISIMVIEKDPTYTRCSTVLSMGGVRQQFSLPENIEMSLFGAQFLRNAHKTLAVEDSTGPDMHFHPQGYLYLANEDQAEQLQINHVLQTNLGAKVDLLSPARLKQKFPWVNTDGVALAAHGLENEGWFDPWSLLYGFKRKAISMGVEYAQGEVVGFEFMSRDDTVLAGEEYPGPPHEAIESILVKNRHGEIKTVKMAYAVLAAGHNSGKIAEMARIGRGEKLLSIPLPVEPRKRYVYFFHAPDQDAPGLDCPLLVDTTGAYFRREGLANYYLAGQSPPFEEEPCPDNLDVDYSYFDNTVWPNIAHRVPAFNNVKVKSAWAGYYDYNTFDQNGIIGPHPYHTNLYLACGFSGHGIQQAAAIGRATAEMILDGKFTTIDLSRLNFERLVIGREVREQNVV